MEIYKPAYLFTLDGSGNIVLAVRPTITSAPSTTTYGSAFTVQTPDAADIASVVMIKAGATLTLLIWINGWWALTLLRVFKR